MAATALLFAAPAAQADVVVVPNGNAAVDGNSFNNFPFNLAALGFPSQRYQQVYAGGQFGGLSGIISEIAFRPNAAGAAFATTGIDVEIRLSHTTAAPGALAADFADNITSPQTLVLDTSNLSLSSAGVSPVFDIVIDIDDLFAYDGVSNLLLDITVLNSPATVLLDAVVGSGVTSRVTSGNAIAASGIPSSIGLVTQFTITPAAVPEPATLAMFGAALAGLALRRRPARTI